MAKKKFTVSKSPARTEILNGSEMHVADRPGTRIRAFLAKVRPLAGCGGSDEEWFWTARALLEALAVSYDAETDHEWTLIECAAVVRFLHSIEPAKSKCYCSDRDGDEVSANCGYLVIVETLEANLLRMEKLAKKKSRAA